MGKFRDSPSTYDKFPYVEIEDPSAYCWKNWDEITSEFQTTLKDRAGYVMVVDLYQGVDQVAYLEELKNRMSFDYVIEVSQALKSPEEIQKMVYPEVTDDRVFGYMTRLKLTEFFDQSKFVALQERIRSAKGNILIFGIGAALFHEHPTLLVYVDMARWEIQQRQRKHLVNNLGVFNQSESPSANYKHSFFVDWRVLDRHKKTLYNSWNYVIDGNGKVPKMICGNVLNEALTHTANRPFRVVPFFDPGPWGGQWMREVCDLDSGPDNFAWCFDCVPEENSLLLKIGDDLFETPSINLVFQQPKTLLGEAVFGRFGDEFPIRFDFLDTMDGGNLSLQVHPLTQYIQEHFGMHYTQDESYYLLDADPESASVYLGMKENADGESMVRELQQAQYKGIDFDADRYVNRWPAKKHDHFLIPAGTIHCSGKDAMVLEISATPYIFTFKLWDWERLGLDGKPRPIHIERGSKNIQWDRTTTWVEKNLINQIEPINEGDGWIEERTGLHKSEFIETRRHWFTKRVAHYTNGGVNVLNLVEGEEVIVESPSHTFKPYIIQYAETFIVPAAVGSYTVRPYGKSENKKCATVKAFVRHG
ncbi:MAG: class I mannose-6-phosphate isomerase [Bacteroidota bacterium]